MIIRSLGVITGATSPTDGDIRFHARPSGGSSGDEVNLTAEEDVLTDNLAHKELAITGARDVVKKGWVLYATVDNLSPSAAEVVAVVGWMPDLWRPGAQLRTF